MAHVVGPRGSWTLLAHVSCLCGLRRLFSLLRAVVAPLQLRTHLMRFASSPTEVISLPWGGKPLFLSPITFISDCRKVSLLLSSSHLIFSAFSNLLSSYPLQSVSNQVGMAVLGSSSDVRFVPFVRSRGTSLGNLKASTSGLSLGVPTPIDAKSLRNLEVMKACHDIDSIVIEESLDAIQQCYSILGEYALRAPLPKQHPYNPGSSELSISVDALEAGLRFPLHPLIEECLGWWRISSSQVMPNSWRYLIAFLGECQGSGIIPSWNLFMACFHLCKSQMGYYLTVRAEFKDAEDVYRETCFGILSYQFTTRGRGGSCGTRVDSGSNSDPEKVCREVNTTAGGL
ncbi:hypothetical protein GW17_00013634 [Ensete ventricosum]|nr:hypothetical protein GW17_00013634 [Ensete ventricosum]